MKDYKLIINTNSKKYPIYIGYNILKSSKRIFKKNNIKIKKCLIVVDKNVPKKNLSVLKKNIISSKILFHSFNANEKNKNLEYVNSILKILFINNFNRDDYIIALGGGITGDVVGFAASIFKRGMKFINIPTTLLSQVDSSIGGKTGVNNIYGKNLVGSFYQPEIVISDVKILNSLNKREIVCGYGEILKHSIISKETNFNYLNKNKFKILNLKSPFLEKAIYDSCKIKKNIVERDEKEKNLRKVLNLGHTFGHAYEASNGYSRNLNHGEAVILGIISSAKFSLINQVLPEKIYKKIVSHIKELNLSVNLKRYFKKKNLNLILKYMKSDKKNNNDNINIILIKNFGKIVLNKRFNDSKIKSFLRMELNN